LSVGTRSLKHCVTPHTKDRQNPSVSAGAPARPTHHAPRTHARAMWHCRSHTTRKPITMPRHSNPNQARPLTAILQPHWLSPAIFSIVYRRTESSHEKRYRLQHHTTSGSRRALPKAASIINIDHRVSIRCGLDGYRGDRGHPCTLFPPMYHNGQLNRACDARVNQPRSHSYEQHQKHHY